jgi:Condensation domain
LFDTCCLAQVFRLSAQEHVLMVVQHHSITDVISLNILGRDLSAAYRAALHRSKPQWPPLSVAYVDYAAWQRANLDTAALEAELAWWRQTLAGAPALLEWQTDRPRPSTMSFAGAQLRFAAPAAVSQGLQQLAAARQTTPFVVLLTVLQVRRGGFCLTA